MALSIKAIHINRRHPTVKSIDFTFSMSKSSKTYILISDLIMIYFNEQAELSLICLYNTKTDSLTNV